MEEFRLDESGELYIHWNINTNLRKLQLNELVSLLIQEYKRTGELYETYIQEDGKLIGNEKVAISRCLRELIQLSIEIKNTLSLKYIKNANHTERVKFTFIDDYSFQLSCNCTIIEMEKIKSVKLWYVNYLKPDILSFINDLKKALEDKIITEEEAINLSNILNEIIMGSAILFNRLSYENIVN